MAQKTDNKEDQSLNPGERRARELNDFENRNFGGIVDNYDKNADSSQEDANIDKARQNLQNQEENPQTPDNPMNSKVTGRGNKRTPVSGKAWLKRKSPIIALITLLGGGGFSIFMFTGFLAPIAFFENVVDDLNDQLAALDIRNEHVFRNKINRGQRAEALKGCTKLSIRCKFNTMSARQVAKLARAGIEVVPDESSGIVDRLKSTNGRVVPKEFRFRGQDFTPREFANALGRNGDPSLKLAFKRGLNMKYLGVSDKTFVGRTLKRFGVSRKPPELRGSHQDRLNALLTRGGVSTASEISFSSFVDDDGETRWVVDGDNSGDSFSNTEKERMEKTAERGRNARPPTRTQSNAIKGLGLLGVADLTCSVKSMLGAAAVAAKVSNAYQMVNHTMPIASLAGSMKAGDISAEDAHTIQEMFNATDNRTHIPDIENSFEHQSEGEFAFVDGDIPMKENPNYGKSMMDSELYKLSSTGKLGSLTPDLISYSLGMGQNRLLQGVSNSAQVIGIIASTERCNFVQNWAVRGLSIIGGVALGVSTGGLSAAALAVPFGIMFTLSMALEWSINKALDGELIDETIEEAPSENAAAVWGGTAEMMGDAARSRGMIPGNADQIVAYQRLQQESMADYTAIAKADADPFDIYDQHSFLGSFARMVGDNVSYNAQASVRSAATGIASLVTGSVSTLLSNSTASAAPIDPVRFEICDDDGYKDIGLNADVQCNLRYFMPEADLARDVDDVARYMEENGYVEVDEETGESITGLPEGYTPPDPAESQSFIRGMLDGVVGSFYNDRNKYGEYGKFLDHCVYRAAPFGDTFEEQGAFGNPGPDWVSGERCLKNDEMISNFRVYTFDKTVQEALDGEGVEEEASSDPINETDVIPVDGEWVAPMARGVYSRISSPYGGRYHPVTGAYQLHDGTDFAAPNGTPYRAAAGGVVTNKGPLPNWSSPTNYIVIDHKNGYETRYGHSELSQIVVNVGDVVQAGQVIGYVGCHGSCTGPHLHFSLYSTHNQTGRLQPVDPEEVFYDNFGIRL